MLIYPCTAKFQLSRVILSGKNHFIVLIITETTYVIWSIFNFV